MGRGTPKGWRGRNREHGSVVRSRAIRSTPPPLRGPPPHSLREQGGDTASHPPPARRFRPTNPLFLRAIARQPASSPSRRKNRPHNPPRPVAPGGSLGRRTEAAAGAEGAGLAVKAAGPDRTGDLLRVIRPGWRTGGDTQVVPGIGIVARPARRRRCGKARTRPPDASFRKTVRAERSSFAETVLKLSHPGEGPGAPPCLPAFPAHLALSGARRSPLPRTRPPFLPGPERAILPNPC